MKRNSLLIISLFLALMVTGCKKDDPIGPSITSDDDYLAGEQVEAGDANSSVYKLFVLNEGNYGSNNASLDFYRYTNGIFVRNAFSKMNPNVPLGLGDTGNDIYIAGNTAWLLMNGSGLVVVVSAIDETQKAVIKVPSPRNITFDDKYAYVSSYSGAYYGGPSRKGSVYRISLSSMQVADSLQVGYQPEGIAATGEKIFVANSGGLNPDGYDNTVTVIDKNSFTIEKQIEVAPNLKHLFYDGRDGIWVSSMGDYYLNHSALYRIDATTLELSGRSGDLADVKVSNLTYDPTGKAVYVVGTDDEWNFTPGASKQYNLYRIADNGSIVDKTPFSSCDLSNVKTPYSIAVDPFDGSIFIGDAMDFQSPGRLLRFTKDKRLSWSVTTGINPGHLVIYVPVIYF